MEYKGLNTLEYIALVFMITTVLFLISWNSQKLNKILDILEKQKSSIVTPTPQKDVE